MKTTTVGLLSLLLASAVAADIIKMETNDFADSKSLIWSGTLQKIDPDSQIAYFSYANKAGTDEFKVHVTRIYSLTLDAQDRVDRPFPVTRQDLTSPLPGNPNRRDLLELNNENFVGDEIPDTVKVRPNDRQASTLQLSGTVKQTVEQGELKKFLLEAKADNRKIAAFEIDRSDLSKWIRGR